jgi:type IV pilus assembly protein PilQ
MEESNQENKIPLLGDVPVVGNLFKNRTKEAVKREMLIFITPKVITDRSASR